MDVTLPVVAAFDFDGTLTKRDTLLNFLFFLEGSRPRTLWKLFLETPHFIQYLLGKASRQKIKECILTRFLSGKAGSDVRKQAERFAQGPLKKCVRAEGLERVLWHQAQGHRCVLISANLNLFLEPWAKAAKFDDCITSVCAVSPDGRLTGKLQGLNCWGPEKARRLHDLLGRREGYLLHVYGDSRGDLEILAMADYSYYCKLR